MITQANSIKTISEAIHAAQEEYLQSKVSRSRWKSNRASGIDDPCMRRIFYYRTCGELADEINPGLVAIFEEGREQEPGVRRFLSELGFEIVRAQSTEEWPEYQISGSVDGIIEWNGQKFIVEIKTVSEYAWEKLHTKDDFDDGYYRKWLGQIQIYMLLFGYEKGIFILKRKQAKEVRVIEVDLDYERAETLLKNAETVNKAISTETPPDFIKNPVECRKCPFFGKVCNPPMDFGEIAIIEDPEMFNKLARRDELADARSEYEKLDKDIKERFREIPDALCGDYHITGKQGVVVYKAREETTVQTWRTKIEKIAK